MQLAKLDPVPIFCDRQITLALWGLFWIVIAVLFSSPTWATSPRPKPLTIAQKLERTDAVFFGSVRRLYFTDEKNAPLDPSQVKGIAGSTAEVEVSEVILDRRKQLTSRVLVPLGGPASTAKERLEKYQGKAFVFFGRFLYTEEKNGRKMAFVKLLPADGVDDPSNLEAIREAVRQYGARN